MNKPIQHVPKRLFKYSILFTSLSLAIGNAHAEQEEDIEIIEVRGIVASNAKNLAIKRTSNSVVDAITAEDVGKFPDKNVADSLQRVPGITISRSGGEGKGVSIRGTSSDWTLTQLNGNYISSSDDGAPTRSFNYTMLPSNMISSVEVYKSSEARLDEGGVGGTVILHTNKPLDMESGQGYMSVEGTYSDTSGKLEPQYSASYSWKNDNETFGILAGFTQQNREVVSIRNSAGGWSFHSDQEGADLPPIVDQATGEVYNNVYKADTASISNNTEQRNRDGYQIAAQWRVNDNLELNFNYFGAKLGYNNQSQSLFFAEWNQHHNAYHGIELDGDTVIGWGQADNGLLNDDNWGDADVNGGVAVRRGLMSPQLTGYDTYGESSSDTYDLEAIYEGDSYVASFNVGRTTASGGISSSTMANIDARNGSVNSWHWSMRDGKPNYDVSTDLSKDKNAYNYYDWYRSLSSENEDREDYYQADLEIDIDSRFISKIRTGIKYRDHKIEGLRSHIKWNNGDNTSDYRGGWLPGDEWFHDVSAHPDPNGLVSDRVINNGAGNTGAINFLAFDIAALNRYVSNNFTKTVVPTLAGTYTINEAILATYAQADFEWNKLRGNFGVRVVNTDLNVLAYDEVQDQANSDATPNIRDSNDTNVLPSLNVVWDINDSLIARFAAAQTMSRVSYENLSRAETYGAPPHIVDKDTWFGQASGTSASADLEALLSNQYDLGLEWYYAEASALGLTLFRKDISNLPISISEVVYRDHDCCNAPIEVRMDTLINGGEATSQGVELFAQHAFDNGFGVMANYTLTDTSSTEIHVGDEITQADIAGTAKHQYNVSSYYEGDSFSARASYNWKDRTAQSVHRGYNIYNAPYGQVDVNASYTLTKELVLTASVINLTKSVEESYWKQENRMTGYNYFGRRFYVGASYQF